MVRAPAKLNLFLELIRKRADGYHDIETVMVPISCYDTLVIRHSERNSIRISQHWRPDPKNWAAAIGDEAAAAQFAIPTDQRNLIYRALQAVSKHAGYQGGWEVTVRKRTPAGAGMGGASSDAAAAIRAAAKLLGITSDAAALMKIAATLGSDVPFFLGGDADDCGAQVAAMRATGRGELLEPLHSGGRLRFLVAFPSQSLSTAAVYGQCTIPAESHSSQSLAQALALGNSAAIGKEMFNRLSEAATILSPTVRDLLQLMQISGLSDCQMTGSGSACFAILGDQHHAGLMLAELRRTLHDHQFGAHVVSREQCFDPAADSFDQPLPLLEKLLGEKLLNRST